MQQIQMISNNSNFPYDLDDEDSGIYVSTPTVEPEPISAEDIEVLYEPETHEPTLVGIAPVQEDPELMFEAMGPLMRLSPEFVDAMDVTEPPDPFAALMAFKGYSVERRDAAWKGQIGFGQRRLQLHYDGTSPLCVLDVNVARKEMADGAHPFDVYLRERNHGLSREDAAAITFLAMGDDA